MRQLTIFLQKKDFYKTLLNSITLHCIKKGEEKPLRLKKSSKNTQENFSCTKKQQISWESMADVFKWQKFQKCLKNALINDST